jgi:truncated hemoglobin YjbI/stress-induced morphogen
MQADPALIDEVNLYKRLGKDAIVDLATAFYTRVYQDEQTWFRDIFSGIPKGEAIRNQWEWLVERLGGPKLFTERKGHPGLMRRHATFPVTEAAAARWLEHMEAALVELTNVDADSRMRLTSFFRHMAYFLAAGLSKPGGPGHAYVEEHAMARAAAAHQAAPSQAPTRKRPLDVETDARIAAATRALMDALSPEVLEVSWVDAEEHFVVMVVSNHFSGMRPLDRQRRVLQHAADHLGEAIAVRAKTPQQWEQFCLHGVWA